MAVPVPPCPDLQDCVASSCILPHLTEGTDYEEIDYDSSCCMRFALLGMASAANLPAGWSVGQQDGFNV